MAHLNMTLAQLRSFLGEGELVGDGDHVLTGVGSLERAGPGDLSFVRDGSFAESAKRSGAGALFVPVEIPGAAQGQLVLPDPNRAFGKVLAKVASERDQAPPGVHPSAVVAPGATVDPTASIGPAATVGEGSTVGPRSVLEAGVRIGRDCQVGADCHLSPNVVIQNDVVVGNRVRIHAGAVLGTDGFGYIPGPKEHFKIPHVGGVRIGDDVEIGALATIARATVDETVVGAGSKIGDSCHVAHNCQVGERVLMLPLSGIAGSVELGEQVVMAGRSSCFDNLTIGDRAQIGAAGSVFENVPAGAQMWGSPAREKDLEFRIQARLRRLPEMRAQIRGGEIGGLLEVRDETINGLIHKMDSMARTLATEVNAAHRLGVDQYGQKGADFFDMSQADGEYSQFIQLSEGVSTDVGRIVTGVAPNSPGDNRVANVISKLQYKKVFGGKDTVDEFYNSIVGELGVQVSRAQNEFEIQSDLLGQLGKIRESISGVSLDEEATKLIEYQKSFDASARLIRTADEMLDTVLSLKR